MNNLTLNSNPQISVYNRNTNDKTHFKSSSGVSWNVADVDVAPAVGGLGVAALLRLSQWGLEQLSKICSNALMKGEEFASETDVKKVAEAMKSKRGLQADIHYLDRSNVSAMKRRFPELGKDLDVVAGGGNAFYTHDGKFVCAPKSKPSLILHELGHAINFEKSTLMRGVQRLRIVGAYAPMVLAYLNQLTGRRSDGEKSFIERNAGLIGFSAFLPTIVEEATASIRGIKAAKETLGAKANLKVLKRNYALAWLTYVIAGIGTGIAAKLAITKE